MIKHYGRYIISDPNICHGKLVFHGTQMFVEEVLEEVAIGKPWETILEQQPTSLPQVAIAEAMRLATEALFTYKEEERLWTKTESASEEQSEGVQETIKYYGQYVIAHPRICHGKLTFRGSRIFVADILEEVASGLSWETIMELWHDSVSEEAITEAIRVAIVALRIYKEPLWARMQPA